MIAKEQIREAQWLCDTFISEITKTDMPFCIKNKLYFVDKDWVNITNPFLSSDSRLIYDYEDACDIYGENEVDNLITNLVNNKDLIIQTCAKIYGDRILDVIKLYSASTPGFATKEDNVTKISPLTIDLVNYDEVCSDWLDYVISNQSASSGPVYVVRFTYDDSLKLRELLEEEFEDLSSLEFKFGGDYLKIILK